MQCVTAPLRKTERDLVVFETGTPTVLSLGKCCGRKRCLFPLQIVVATFFEKGWAMKKYDFSKISFSVVLLLSFDAQVSEVLYNYTILPDIM